MDEQSKGKGLKAKKRKIEGRDYAAEETGKESRLFPKFFLHIQSPDTYDK